MSPIVAMGFRLRYAPSPTGSLHLGGLRTALYNYVMARQSAGSFILRIEDTDQKRTVPGSSESMVATFRRLGLHFDEGPAIGGAYGPYIQSERLSLYREHAHTLLETNHGYRCFCTPERVDLVRKVRAKQGLPSTYDGHCLSLDDADIAKRLDDNVPHVIRLRPPSDGATRFDDLVRGPVTIENKYIDHQVLMKSDGFPTYHLASVVDDHLMKITHVVRGEEWLASTPKHVVLYDAFRWEKPVFAHLPLLLTTTRAKLSKRHQHSSVEHLLETGYLPSAIVHFAATMGWNPTVHQLIHGPMMMDDLIKAFEVDRVQKGGAQVDVQRLMWLSGLHFRVEFARNPESIVEMVRAFSPDRFQNVSNSFLKRVIAVVVERVCLLGHVFEFGSGLLTEPQLNSQELRKLRVSQEQIDRISLQVGSQSSTDPTGMPLPTLRYILIGDQSGPPIKSILSALGPSRALQRLRAARLLAITQQASKLN